MSLKLPRKSKAQNTIYSDESDEENDQQKNKSIRKTEPLKRKRYTRNANDKYDGNPDERDDADFEETGLFYLIEYVEGLKRDEYTVVNEKQIEIDTDSNYGKVKHYDQQFRVKILKRGNILKLLLL